MFIIIVLSLVDLKIIQPCVRPHRPVQPKRQITLVSHTSTPPYVFNGRIATYLLYSTAQFHSVIVLLLVLFFLPLHLLRLTLFHTFRLHFHLFCGLPDSFFQQIGNGW